MEGTFVGFAPNEEEAPALNERPLSELKPDPELRPNPKLEDPERPVPELLPKSSEVPLLPPKLLEPESLDPRALDPKLLDPKSKDGKLPSPRDTEEAGVVPKKSELDLYVVLSMSSKLSRKLAFPLTELPELELEKMDAKGADAEVDVVTEVRLFRGARSPAKNATLNLVRRPSFSLRRIRDVRSMGNPSVVGITEKQVSRMGRRNGNQPMTLMMTCCF